MFRTSRWSLSRLNVNVCILGGGPAGIAAALRAVDFNKSVCIVEKGRIGGNDFWNGTLQSKMWWEMSKFSMMLRGTTGTRLLDVNSPQLDQEKIRATLHQAAATREQQVFEQLQATNVQVVQGQGMFTSPDEVEVMSDDGSFTSVNADYFIIATGSIPREHPQYRSDGKVILTSEHIMQMDMPKSLVIVGGGIIGCEYASILANFGVTKVNLIERGNRILPMEDSDVGSFIEQLLTKKDVTFHHRSQLRSLRIVDGRVRYTIKNLETHEKSTYDVDKALVSIGREPNYVGLGLETTKCRIENGRLLKDKFLRCVPHRHIYACGDAVAEKGQMLLNAAEHQARSCIEHMYSRKPQERKPYDNLSSILFLDQEVAAVGLNEQECRQKNISYMMARYGYEFVSRAVAMNNTKGFVKIVVTNDREKRVLGVRAVGPHASSVVELASLAIHNNQSAYELTELLTAYPAVTQGFQECLRMLLGRSILKHHVFNGLVVNTWNPPDFDRGRAYQANNPNDRRRSRVTPSTDPEETALLADADRY